jgi:hypothetical protein
MPNWKKVITSGSSAELDSLKLTGLLNAGLDTDKFLVLDSAGNIDFRTGDELRTDIGVDAVFATTASNTFKGDQTFSGSVLPATANTYDLGSEDNPWDSLYVNGTSIYMRDPSTLTFVTMSATNGVLSFNNSKLNAPLGFTSIASITGSDVKIDDWGSVSASLASIDSGVSNLTLQDVTNNGSTTTNSITLGGLTVSGDVSITGTASIAYLESQTGTAKIIGDAYIILNANSPTSRYSGIKVYDSGSSDTGSLEYDSVNNHWFYESTSEGYASGLIAGPRDSRGNITFPPNNRIPKGIGGNHISASSISDDGSTITLGNDTVVVGNLSATTISNVLSGSAQIASEISGAFTAASGGFSTRITTLETDLNTLESKTLVSSSTQIDHDTTTNFVANEHIDHTSVSITAGNGLSGGGTIAATRTLTLNTSSAHFTDGVKKKLNTEGVISSSAQLTGEFDTRYLNTTGDNVISSSAQVNISSTTGYTSFSSSIASDIASIQGSGYVDVSSGGVSNRIAIFSDADSLKGDADVTYYSGYNPQLQVYGVWDDVNSEGIKSKTLTTQAIYVGQVGTNFTASIALESNRGPLSWYTETKAVGFNVSTSGTHAIHADAGHAFFINYHLGDGTNFRAGTITINTNYGNSVVFSETSTADIGNTSLHQFSVGYSLGTMTLYMSTTGGCEGTMEVRRMVSI